ncbi:MAG: hypothetical protein ABIR46_03615 [Candidatus Saccharimonadales bacterium]
MSLHRSNILEGFSPSSDPENAGLTDKESKDLDKRASKINKALSRAAGNGVQKELVEYLAGEVERLKTLHDVPAFNGE